MEQRAMMHRDIFSPLQNEYQAESLADGWANVESALTLPLRGGIKQIMRGFQEVLI